jgi:hypothetical protein
MATTVQELLMGFDQTNSLGTMLLGEPIRVYQGSVVSVQAVDWWGFWHRS